MNDIDKDNILTQTGSITSGDGRNFNTVTSTVTLSINIGQDDLGELIRSLEKRIEKLEKFKKYYILSTTMYAEYHEEDLERLYEEIRHE
jgi:hypothetical protein